MFVQTKGAGNIQKYDFGLQYTAGRNQFVLTSGSAEMGRMFKTLGKLLNCNTPLLFQGDPGVGKKTWARIAHQASKQSQYRLTRFDCAALDAAKFYQTLAAATNSEPDTVDCKPGMDVFDGTILLNRVEQLSAQMQALLLKVFREKILSLPGEPAVLINARVIATSTYDLQRLMQRGIYDRDLYYRLSVYTFRLPVLAERAVDVPAFVEYFSRIYAHKKQSHIHSFSNEAIEILQGNTWRHNLTELRETVIRSIAAGNGQERITGVQWEMCADRQQSESNAAISQLADEHEVTAKSPRRAFPLRALPNFSE